MSNFLDEFPVLNTDRLILRKIEEEDAKDLYGYYSNPNVTRYLNWNGPHSIENAIEVINEWNKDYDDKNFIRWAITLKEVNTIIGTVVIATKDKSTKYGLFTHPITDTVCIGYELSEDYWNKGIMSEALEVVIDFVFNEIKTHRIQADIEPDNKSSYHLLQKMGFIEEGLLRKYLYDNDTRQFDDVILVSLLVDEHRGLKVK